jgi:hypothetical protein
MTAPDSGVYFVSKFNSSGTGLIYSTFVGGTGNQRWDSGAVDSSGAVYVSGNTTSADFPTTAGAYRTTPYPYVQSQGVVFKLSPDGSQLDYSTYLAPNMLNSGFGRSVALGPGGSVIVTGYTSSDLAPTTPGAFQTAYPGGQVAPYVAELNATGSGLNYATYLGAPITNQSLGGSPTCNGNAVATDAQGDAYIAETCVSGFPTTPGAYQADSTANSVATPVLIKLLPDGSQLGYATYYGTAQTPTDVMWGTGVAVDSAGDAYLSTDMAPGDAPVTSGAYASNCTSAPSDCVAVAEFNPTGTGLTYSTYFGGGAETYGISVDGDGNAYIVGAAAGGTIPITSGAYSSSPGDFSDPFFLAVFGKGNLLYSTYLGGTGTVSIGGISGNAGQITIAPEVQDGSVYVGGFTSATDFPVTQGAFQTTNQGGPDDPLNQDAWAAKFTLPAFPS